VNLFIKAEAERRLFEQQRVTALWAEIAHCTQRVQNTARRGGHGTPYFKPV